MSSALVGHNGSTNEDEGIHPKEATNEESQTLRSDSQRSGSKSPENCCAICLSELENRSFTDSCLHEFCFTCLVEWSKVRAVCPLCKQSFNSIIHSVRSIEDYKQLDLSSLQRSSSDARRVPFRYRTTATHGFFQEVMQLQHEHERNLLQRPSRSNNTAYDFWRRTRQDASSSFRRSVYSQGLRVKDVLPRVGQERVMQRIITPEFLQRNPACIHRLVPWLNRELNALLQGSSTSNNVQLILELILDLVKHFHIQSAEFREHLVVYLQNYTEHFIHEFYSFATSPYDISMYDRQAVYDQAATAAPTGSPPLTPTLLPLVAVTPNQPSNHHRPRRSRRLPEVIELHSDDDASVPSAEIPSTSQLPSDDQPSTSAGTTSSTSRVPFWLRRHANPERDVHSSTWDSPDASPVHLPLLWSPEHNQSRQSPDVSVLYESLGGPLFPTHNASQPTAGPSILHQVTVSPQSSHSSDIEIIDVEKPWDDRSPILLSSADDSPVVYSGKGKGKRRRSLKRTPPQRYQCPHSESGSENLYRQKRKKLTTRRRHSRSPHQSQSKSSDRFHKHHRRKRSKSHDKARSSRSHFKKDNHTERHKGRSTDTQQSTSSHYQKLHGDSSERSDLKHSEKRKHHHTHRNDSITSIESYRHEKHKRKKKRRHNERSRSRSGSIEFLREIVRRDIEKRRSARTSSLSYSGDIKMMMNSGNGNVPQHGNDVGQGQNSVESVGMNNNYCKSDGTQNAGSSVQIIGRTGSKTCNMSPSGRCEECDQSSTARGHYDGGDQSSTFRGHYEGHCDQLSTVMGHYEGGNQSSTVRGHYEGGDQSTVPQRQSPDNQCQQGTRETSTPSESQQNTLQKDVFGAEFQEPHRGALRDEASDNNAAARASEITCHSTYECTIVQEQSVRPKLKFKIRRPTRPSGKTSFDG